MPVEHPTRCNFVTTYMKSVGFAVLLVLFFGPLGLLYPSHARAFSGEVYRSQDGRIRITINSSHYCPARNSGGHRNPLKISVITHARSENDLN